VRTKSCRNPHRMKTHTLSFIQEVTMTTTTSSTDPHVNANANANADARTDRCRASIVTLMRRWRLERNSSARNAQQVIEPGTRLGEPDGKVALPTMAMMEGYSCVI